MNAVKGELRVCLCGVRKRKVQLFSHAGIRAGQLPAFRAACGTCVRRIDPRRRNEKNPQTGSFEENINGEALSLRFAIVTSAHNTSGVLRILNNHSSLSVSELCHDPDTVSWLSHITSHRDGLYILSGPTGSGKTTALYTILNACKGKKIFTIEDPIEVYSSSYIQLQVNEKQHMSYGEGIKQLMRHDPDIVMIGEIRDSEAARMAVRCALTGHLVVSSLHASSCVSAILRLEELGVSDYQLMDVLHGISNQRLYRMKDGKMAGIYEYMTRKEVQYYFEEKHTDRNFRSLEERIRAAVAVLEMKLERK